MKTNGKELTLTTLTECEAVISKGMNTFVEVGLAIKAIKDERLYHTSNGGKYTRFEDYCKERWGWGRHYANRLAEAADVTKRIESVVPMGTKPTAERQARPLAALPEEEQTDAWNEAVEESGGQPTAATVQSVVDNRTQRDAPKSFIHQHLKTILQLKGKIVREADEVGGSFADEIIELCEKIIRACKEKERSL